VTEIHVTDGDINGANPVQSGNPVARAMRRTFPDARWVVAGHRVLGVTFKDRQDVWNTPPEVTAALDAALEGTKMKTLSFVLPAAPDYTRASRTRPAAKGQAA
jgi:hypothetical protein